MKLGTELGDVYDIGVPPSTCRISRYKIDYTVVIVVAVPSLVLSLLRPRLFYKQESHR